MHGCRHYLVQSNMPWAASQRKEQKSPLKEGGHLIYVSLLLKWTWWWSQAGGCIGFTIVVLYVGNREQQFAILVYTFGISYIYIHIVIDGQSLFSIFLVLHSERKTTSSCPVKYPCTPQYSTKQPPYTNQYMNIHFQYNRPNKDTFGYWETLTSGGNNYQSLDGLGLYRFGDVTLHSLTHHYQSTNQANRKKTGW